MLDWLRISKFLSFQNILCYCLSCGLSAAGDVRRNFKTSYVIVYHKYHFLVYMHLLYFKTSYVIVYRNVGNWLGCAKKYFKTSYVIVYHVPSTLSSDCSLYFKTSYVIVYLPCDIWHCGVFKISKHLMLLFINFHCGMSDKQNYFKTSYVIVYRNAT